MKVRELMTHEVATVRAGERLDRVAAILSARDCGCVPVVDEGGRVVAVITDRDVCLATARADASPSAVPVEAAMSRELHCCRADETIGEAEQRMGLHQVRRLPVVDARGRLVGILSLDDVAREACKEEDLIAPPVSAEAVGLTLGRICRKRLVAGAGS